jgi:iron complex transport system substrate-binding protein
MVRSPVPRVMAWALLTAVVAAACGGGATSVPPSPSTVTTQAAFPVTVQAGNGSVTIAARPERIVSLSPTATEMLFAVGAGDQVVAVDEFSNYPPEAPTTKLSGYQPNVEAIGRYTPDLVVISNDIDGLVDALGKLSVPVLLEPAANDLDESYAQIEQLGAATGHVADAAGVVASMRSKIQAIVSSAGALGGQSLSYYHELDQTFYSATSTTFIGQVYGLLGLKSIADGAKGAASGYPQLSAEYIIKSDPAVIFLADSKCCGQSAKTVARRPGWSEIAAVKDGAVFALDDDLVSRWGPRVVDFLQTIAQDLESVREAVST